MPVRLPSAKSKVFWFEPSRLALYTVTGEVGDEHPPAFQVQSQADPFHQMPENNLGIFAHARRRIHGRPAYRVAARRVPAIGPVHHPIGEIELQIDRLRQVVIE